MPFNPDLFQLLCDILGLKKITVGDLFLIVERKLVDE
jgi:hypothetical protein